MRNNPFVKVGERVRYIDPRSRGRRGDWPKDSWLEYGITGTVTEYHAEIPAVTIRGEYFEGIKPYAVVRWDLSGDCDTAIDPKDEGKRWETVLSHSPELLPQTKFGEDDLLQYYKVPRDAF